MTKLLIVDDDQHIRELMVLFLQNEGYELMEATNGREALALMATESIGLVILDVMMPEMDGWQLLKAIRQIDSDIPLLMVTAKGEAMHKVKGFQLGTDDYLTKPFDPMELVLRVKALLKRAKISASQTLRLGHVELHRHSHEVIRHNQSSTLPLKEFELLFTLASYPGQIFTREQLITSIWGMDYQGDDRTVDVHIKRLRSKFADDHDSFRIESARSLGYRLVLT